MKEPQNNMLENNSNNNNNKKKKRSSRFCTLSLPLLFSLWCVVFVFYSIFGLAYGGNEGESQTFNQSLTNSTTCNNKSCNDASLVEESGHKENLTGVFVEFNISVVINDSAVYDHSHANPEYSLQGTSALEDSISIILGYTVLKCKALTREEHKEDKPAQLQNGRIHLTYPDLDEFRNITSQEKALSAPSQLVNITHRLEPDGTPYNYASAAKGAKVVAHNKEAKGANNILGKDHDKYLRNPCSAEGKYFVIELADETLVDTVKIANFEHYSSNFKEFELSGSLVYPAETWNPLGTFVAANVKHGQSFKLPEPKWVRYLKVNLLSHYGSEFYCILSVVEVYGVDAIEQMLEDLIVTSGDSSINKLPIPNSTVLPPVTPKLGSFDHETEDVVHNVVHAVNKEIESVTEGPKLNNDAPKVPATTTSIHDPKVKVKQQSNGRIHSDAAVKVLLQKVRALELNLSLLEEYIKELNKRQGDFLPELDKELAKFSVLLEQSKSEIRNLLEWKQIMEKDVAEIESWKAYVSTQVDLLVRENGMLRSEVEKVVTDQASLEKKELAMLAVSFSFACIATLKLISDRVFRISGASAAEKVFKTSKGWFLILVSSITIFFTLLCS